MRSVGFAVQLERVPEGLERLLRLLRSLAVPVHGLTIDFGAPSPGDLVLRIGPTRIPNGRLVAEIESLIDVVSVRMIDPDTNPNPYHATPAESTTDGHVRR